MFHAESAKVYSKDAKRQEDFKSLTLLAVTNLYDKNKKYAGYPSALSAFFNSAFSA